MPRHVFSDVELGEEDKEHDSMSGNEVSIFYGEAAIWDKEELDWVHKNANELDHLQVGHVPFPPDVLLVLWSHGCKHVV